MSVPPPTTTTFTPRGKLNGVLREPPSRRTAPGQRNDPAQGAEPQPTELDTQAYEALYYRARLVLGEALPRPARFQLRGIGGD
jgi:hypothetical protein